MITSKDLRMHKIAKKLIKLSSHPKYKMAAVLARGPKILSFGVNKENSAPKHFVKKHHPKMNLHAEVDALCGIPKEVSKGSTLYVVGQTRGGFAMLTKPCLSCYALLVEMEIKRVVFATRSGDLEEMKIWK